jgi:adenylate cyclase
VGDAVNIASRLMDEAAGGQILISQPTAEELAPEFKLAKLRTRRVRGRSEPVQIFRVEWREVRTSAKKRRLPRGATAD